MQMQVLGPEGLGGVWIPSVRLEDNQEENQLLLPADTESELPYALSAVALIHEVPDSPCLLNTIGTSMHNTVTGTNSNFYRTGINYEVCLLPCN